MPADSKALTDSEILGNAFVFILAGHETTANALHFSCVQLAMYPERQKALQANLDEIMAEKPDPNDWTYEDDFPKLFGSLAAGVLNETLRLIPAVVGIYKRAPAGQPQRLVYEGGETTIPGDAWVVLHSPGLHRNPSYWPPVPNKDGTIDPDDANQFKPERWLLQSQANSSKRQESQQDRADLTGPSGPDTSAALFKPEKGAYVPFSEGHRSCLGRRFAQVEAVAVIAYLFRFYSVELALDEWASDEELARMSEQERKQTWEKGRSRAEWLLKYGMRTMITLQLKGGHIPIRLVPRGQERFWNCV
jgi:cytochrome P450